MNSSLKSNKIKIISLVAFSLVGMIAYMLVNVNFKFFEYSMTIRAPKLVSMVIAAFCIGTASIVFQSVINNRIVTPCLLGMNSLYITLHTALVFFLGSSSILIRNSNISFVLDLAFMGVIAVTIYSYLFKKTNYNVLYVLLVGTILSTLFTSISSALMRTMDPNEYTALQNDLISSFNNVNAEILVLAVIAIITVIIFLRKDIAILDVITLGKNQAINLGVDYDRTVRRLLIGVTLFIAIATAIVGPISFLGLILANLARQLFKTYKHSYLMAGSALIGIILLTFGQMFIEHVLSYSTSIAVFINIFGGAYFLYLLVVKKGGS